MSARSRTRAWRLASAVAVTTALAVPGLANAQERPVVFSLRMAPGPLDECGGADALTRSVDERLRRSVFGREDDTDIVFAITAKAGSAEIVESDRAGAELGRRDVPLPAEDCGKALDTLAVVLAIMVGPPRTTTDPPRLPRPPIEWPLASPVTTVPRRPPPRPAPAPRWRVGPTAGVVVGSGVLPGVAWGVEGGVVVEPPVKRLSTILRGAYWPAQTTGTEPPADIDRVGGSLLGCYELMHATLNVAACGGIDLSRVEARSGDLTRPSEASLLVGLLGELRLGYRLALRESVFIEPVLAAQISGLIRRDRFTYRDANGRVLTLLEPAFGAAQAGFGVVVHFL